jgi:hypothetical protein
MEASFLSSDTAPPAGDGSDLLFLQPATAEGTAAEPRRHDSGDKAYSHNNAGEAGGCSPFDELPMMDAPLKDIFGGVADVFGDNAGGMGGWDDLQPPSALRCTEFGKDCLVLEWAAPRSTEPLAGYILHCACVHRHPRPVACSVRQKHAPCVDLRVKRVKRVTRVMSGVFSPLVAEPRCATDGVCVCRLCSDGQAIELGPDSTAFRVTNLEAGTKYTYCVSAKYSQGRFSANSAPPLAVATAQAQPRARSINLGTLGMQLRGAVSVQDRRSGLTKHRDCFVGCEAVVWLQGWLRQGGYADTERDAVTLGNQLMDTGLFEHVTKDHIFKNRDLYYRFVLSVDDPDSDTIRSAPVSPADDALPIARDARMEDGAGAPYASAETVHFSLDGGFQDDAGMFDAANFETEFYSGMDADMAMADTPEQRSEAQGADRDSKAAATESSDTAAFSQRQGEAASMLSTEVAIEFNMHTKAWNHIKTAQIPWLEVPRTLTKEMLQNVPIKGRHSKEEKDAERRAEEILRTPGWMVTRETPLEDLEHLVVVLCKCLERCVREEATAMTWCVGGSLQATLDARGPDGTTPILRFLLCNKADWTGDKRSKIGNTCKFHCGGIRVSNVMIGGQLRSDVNLKKCTWLKCCYGKKHYGDPPLIPWCSQCEYQKKLIKRNGAKAPTPDPPLVNSMRNCKISKVRPCKDCVAELVKQRAAGVDVRHFQTCDSCTTLIRKIDRLSQDLVSTNYSMGGVPAGNKKRQKKEIPDGFRTKVKDVMLVIFAELGLKAHAKMLDPILLDALESKYGAASADDLWDNHEEARGTLMRLVLRNVSMGYHLYQAIQANGAQMDSNHAALLRTVNMPDFMTSWNAVLVRDGCVMVAYVCDKGLATPATKIVARNPAHFTSIGISAVASVISDRVDRVVCTDGLAAVEPVKRTFGVVPVALEGSTELFMELIQGGYDSDAVRWLQNDPSLASWRGVDGKGALHFACSARRELVLHHLLRSKELRSLSKLLAFVHGRDYFGKTAVECSPVGSKARQIVSKKIQSVAATTVQKHARRVIAVRSSKARARALAQSVADAGRQTDRLRFLAELASACKVGDTMAAQMWCNQLKEYALETLDLDDLGIVSVPPAICSDSMASLEILSLINNSLTSLPSDLKCLPFLRGLFLDNNDFGVVPSVISEMDSLAMLSMRNNKLATLPTSLLDLAELQDVFLEGNLLTGALADVPNSWSSIREHLQSRRDSQVRDQVYTVVLVGPHGAGKTTLSKALQKHPSTFQSLWARSRGTPCNDWADLPELQLSIIDASDNALGSSGSLPFIAQRDVAYVVVCDVTTDDWRSDLQTWLQHVSSHTESKACNIVVVCSHAYERAAEDKASMHADLTAQFPTLSITEVFLMDCRVTKEAQEVRSHLCSIAGQILRAQPLVSAVFPEVHEVVHDLGESDGPILSVSEVCQEAEKQLGTSSTVTMQAVKYLAARGRLVHLHGGENDSFDVVVADISWLHTLFGAVVEAANENQGIIDMARIHTMLTRCSTQDPALLLRLLLKLEVCFPTKIVARGASDAIRAVVVPSATRPSERVVPWPVAEAGTPCVGYSFVFNGKLPPNFFHRLQTRLHVRVDRRCVIDRWSVALSGSTLGRCGQRAWVRFDAERRIDVVVVGQHPGPAAAIIVAMVQQMQTDESYPGLAATCKRYLLCQDGIRTGQVPALVDEEGVRDAVNNPALLAAKQRLSLARSGLSIASKQRVIKALPSATAAAKLVLAAKFTDDEHLNSMMLLHPDGRLDLAVTGMVSIERQPQTVTVLRGDRAMLRVDAAGSRELTYQWYRGPHLLLGETFPIISVTSVCRDDEGSYSCVVSNEVGSVRSASAALSSYVTYPEPVAPPVLADIVPSAYKLQLIWTAPRAFGEAVVEYRAQLCRVSEGGEVSVPERTVSGFAAASATISGLELDTLYRVRIAARNHAGWGEYGAWSESARTLAVPPPKIAQLSFSTISALDQIATVVANPKYAVVAVEDDLATFEVAVQGSEPLNLQWYHGDTLIPEATNTRTFTITSVSSKDAGSYSCTISNSYGEVRTPQIDLGVYGPAAVAAGECVTCKDNHARLWTLDCDCGLFGVCACCTQEFMHGSSRCPRCAGEASGVKNTGETHTADAASVEVM